MLGTIKKLVKDKGYGFIKTEDGQEVYFHKTELAPGIIFGALKRGEELRFFVEEGRKGKKAVTIIKA